MIKVYESTSDSMPELIKGDKIGFGVGDDTECTVKSVRGDKVFYTLDYSRYPDVKSAHISNISIVRRDGDVIWTDTRHKISEDFENTYVDIPGIEVSEYEPDSDWSGFMLRIKYPGDELSDYTTNVIVRANSKQDAYSKFNNSIDTVTTNEDDLYILGIEKVIDSIVDYKEKYPYSNYNVIE